MTRRLLSALVSVLAATSLAAGADRFWNDPLGGVFTDVTKWDDGMGDVPDADDAAIFALDAVYTVHLLDPRSTDRLVVRAGSVGLDDWEWGVSLHSDDMLVFKKLIYEMRFDPASSLYAEFGPFYVGIRREPAELESLLAV